ncbi:c-type cytochrome biogenesis protein CcmI [Palleronia sp. KMU-117]|uniref:c-type cytochrome biogenesis protein CcmI n=1 Tax=Palleronia sp. KMU-117 TaxID=3434108 RepID=UPI003D71B3CC
MAFWIISAAMAIGVGALLALAMIRARRGAGIGSGSSDVQVYRDQLKEVDRDLARGVLSPEEAEQVRIEISRRLLDADRKAAEGDTAAAGQGVAAAATITTPLGALALGAVVVAAALALYGRLGAPGYPDLPLATRIEMAEAARAARPTQETAEAEIAARVPPVTNADPQHLQLVEQLRAALATRPDDLTGYTLLTRNEAALGNFAAARKAQARVIELLGDRATAADYADLADLMILAAGGFVSPEAEDALLQTLNRDPGNGTALYYSGLLYIQTGRPDRAFALWRPLLERSTPEDPWYLPVRAQIEELALRAGVTYTPPAPTPPPMAGGGLRGPSAADVEAAQEMTAEDRQAMIENMVAGLSDRLASEGGTAEEWARLITALGVLGRTDEARAIADEALTAFASEPAALPVIEEARQRAGIAE